MKSAFCFIGLAAVFTLAGCGDSGGARPQQVAAGGANGADTVFIASDAKGLQTVTVRASTIPEYLELPARIEADPTTVVHVFAPAGGRIVEVKVRPWERVAKGQTLATLESGDLAHAVADYHKAVSDNQVKQKELARSQDLYQHNAVSERDLQQAQADAEQSNAELEAARAAVRAYGMDPDHASAQLVLTAPRAGVILEVAAAPGEFSQALSAPAPLCTIADTGVVWAVGDVYEKDLLAMRSGEPAQVAINAYPGQQWTGRISAVSQAVDPATRSLQVRVKLANPGGRLKPGLFGTIRVERSSAQGILVPSAAVIREGNDAFVFVAKGGGRFERRSVNLGRTADGTVEIASGVNAGETIVSEGALLLRPSQQD